MAAQQTFAFFQTADPVGKTARTPKARPLVSPAPKQVAEKPPAPKTPLPKTLAPKPPATAADDTASLLKKLRHQVGCVSTDSQNHRETRSTGCTAIDDLLPSGGLRVDALTEWVAASSNSSAGVLSLIAAANQLRHVSPSSPLVVVDTDLQFYPPAAIALGIPAEQIVLVRIQRHADVVWAIDQALRCDAVGAVWANVGSWLDDRDARRFQLAAEIGKTAGLLVRSAAVRGRPSFADVRFHVDQISPASLRVAPSSLVARVTVDRCRGGTTGQQVLVEVNDQAQMIPLSIPLRTSQPAAHHDTASTTSTAAVHLANQLAHPAPTQPGIAAQREVDSNQERRA